MLGSGYKESQGDHTLFIKHSSKGQITILLEYVDDIIGDDVEEKRRLQDQLAREFEIKSLEVAYSKQGIFPSQRKYSLNLRKETGQIDSKA